MTRYAKKLGTQRHLTANGRLWTVERSQRARMLAEVTRTENGFSFFPGMWAGQPRLGFATLEGAGYWRKRAMVRRDRAHHALFKIRARDAIFASIEMRRTHELMVERREMLKEAEDYLRRAA